MGHKAMHVLVSGRVQGVAFRFHTRDRARALGLDGWVRNLTDGRVEVLAAGADQALEDLYDWLGSGPILARVDERERSEVQASGLSEFDLAKTSRSTIA